MERRMDLLGKGLLALGAWAAIASVWAIVTNTGAALDGEVWGMTRIGIGAIGIAGAALLVSGHRSGTSGWYVIAAWSALQLPYYAGGDQENYTRQLVDGLVGMSSSTTVNGEVTSAEAIGLNLVGIVLVIVAMASRKRLALGQSRAIGAQAAG